MALLSPVSLGRVEIFKISQENIILCSALAPGLEMKYQKSRYFDNFISELV